MLPSYPESFLIIRVRLMVVVLWILGMALFSHRHPHLGSGLVKVGAVLLENLGTDRRTAGAPRPCQQL